MVSSQTLGEMGRLSSSGVSDEECMMGDAHLPQPLNVDGANDEGVSSNGGCSLATAVVVVVDAGNCSSRTSKNFEEEFRSVVICNHNTSKFV